MSSHTTSVCLPFASPARQHLTPPAEISSEQTQLVINSITDAYNAEGQANPMNQPMLGGMGGFGAPPPGFPPVGFPPPGNLSIWLSSL